MYTPEELRELYRRLAAPFPEDAVERTKASVTRRGYDTTGIKYQYIVNRLNEVLGVGGFRVTREFAVRERETRSGYAMVEATCDLTMQLGAWQNGVFVPFAEASGTGGHTAASEADAKKGAFTNGFKKVAAFFGCGWQAYAGVLDDDNLPTHEVDADPGAQAKPWQPGQTQGRSSVTRTPVATNENGRGQGNGRVTSAQMAKLHELVEQVGGQWSSYRDHVREVHGVNVEYADRKLASTLIDELLVTVRKQRGGESLPTGKAA